MAAGTRGNPAECTMRPCPVTQMQKQSYRHGKGLRKQDTVQPHPAPQHSLTGLDGQVQHMAHMTATIYRKQHGKEERTTKNVLVGCRGRKGGSHGHRGSGSRSQSEV